LPKSRTFFALLIVFFFVSILIIYPTLSVNLVVTTRGSLCKQFGENNKQARKKIVIEKEKKKATS
jgi:hypothetical protein